jgi:hypothetical protein
MDQFEVIADFEQAANTGRSIVPLLGAGISVESGIPALSSLTQYLAKVQHYISHAGIFSSPGRRKKETAADPILQHYRSPSRYLQNLGWPDPYQLNADLWRWIDEDNPNSPEQRGLLQRKVQEEILNDMRRSEEKLVKRIKIWQEERAKLLQDRKLPQALEELFGRDWELQGNWRSLLAYLTDANPDFADTLFQRLIKNRQPSTVHRFLAFLTPLLQFRLFLTTNFDNLLEESLRLDGLQPVVYSVSRSSPLPHPSLVQQDLSVVKLHGGAFGLRVGETLDQPLDEDSKVRLRMYLPRQPILLVMGVGGWDRRVMDIVHLVIERRREEGARRGAKTGPPGFGASPAVYWMHFESECPQPVKSLIKATRRGEVCPVRTYNPGAFLMELHSRLTGAHPPSPQPYSPQVPRPIVRPRETPLKEQKPIRFFVDTMAGYDLGASLELARLAAEHAATHTPIWIDLEAMQTVPEVVTDILRQIWKYDTALPPLAHEDERGALAEPVRRIYDALARGRYLLAFNAVGSFGRPPTFHHGTLEPQRDSLAQSLTNFLFGLYKAAHRDFEWRPEDRARAACKGRLKDSILAFAIDYPPPAFFRKVEENLSDLVHVEWLQGLPEPPRLAKDLAENREAMLLISAFRRRRSTLGLRQLLPGHLSEGISGHPAGEWVNNLLTYFEESNYLLRVAGGYYWISRRLRDHIYQDCQAATRSRYLTQALTERAEGRSTDLSTPLDQLTSLAVIHDELADYYYSGMFSASQDIHALLEHLYHRISALRYLTKLDLWLRTHLLSIPDPKLDRARQRLSRAAPTEGDLPLNAYVQRLRLRHLRSLRRVVEREGDRLLSVVPPDTLWSWIEWIQLEDCPRFWVGTCLGARDEEGRPNEEVRRRFWNQLYESVNGKEEEREAANDPMERQILDECRELDLQLDKLKALLLRGKMDFAGCMRLRSRQIFRWLGDIWAEGDSTGEWLSGDKKTALEEKASGATPAEHRHLVECLADLWACLRWRGDQHAVQAGELVGRIVAQATARPASDCDRNLNSLRVHSLRQSADQELTGISPWDLKGASLRSILSAEERCRQAILICDEALETIEWTTGRSYARNKSYFHSLRGRAHYILGDFDSAHREIDLSQVGFAANTGVDREALGASLLRLAECLVLRADAVVLRHCLDFLPEVVPDALSAEGRQCLLGCQAPWAGLPDGSPPEHVQKVLQRCLSNWSAPFLKKVSTSDLVKFGNTLARAEGRLLRARGVLDRAEAMLTGARQNREWWVCLYQLRAQIQIELLLVQITSPVHPGEDWRSFNARFVHALQEGLRAIRQGLDLLVPRTVEKVLDIRLRRLLRTWIELMLCGGYLTRLTSQHDPSVKTKSVPEATLWKWWQALNRTARLSKLVRDREHDSFIETDPLEAITSYSTGLEARADVLSAIKSFVRKDRVNVLARTLGKSPAP